MKGVILDEILPGSLTLPTSLPVRHVSDLGESPTDSEIWSFASENDLIIVTKDADFSALLSVHEAPPKVVHLRFGNLRLREMKSLLEKKWPDIESALDSARLVNLYADRIETIS